MTVREKRDNLLKDIEKRKAAINKWYEANCSYPFEPNGGVIIMLEDLVYKLEKVMDMTPDEIQRIKSIPVYSTDWRSVKDIKEKYGLSWNDLKMVAGLDFE